jgi:hypothetical protein
MKKNGMLIFDHMKDDKEPVPGSEEHWDWVTKRAEARAKKIAGKSEGDFDETGLLSGGEDALKSSDAESFPGEQEEYNHEERKPKLVNPHAKDKK